MPTLTGLKISTTVRLIRGAEIWLPSWTARKVIDWFCTTRRVKAVKPVTDPNAHRFELETDGGRVVAWDWAPEGGSASTVLLVHGWNGWGAQYEPMARALVKAGHHVLLVDLPGHGESPGTSANLFKFAAAVKALAHRVGGVDGVVGHSLGGAAVAFALSEGLETKRVALVAPAVEVSHFTREMAQSLGLSAETLNRMNRHLESLVGRKLEQFDVAKIAAGRKEPALVFHDRKDRKIPYAHGAAVARAWPNATLVTSDGLGHDRILQAPETIEQVVRFFDTAERRLAA